MKDSRHGDQRGGDLFSIGGEGALCVEAEEHDVCGCECGGVDVEDAEARDALCGFDRHRVGGVEGLMGGVPHVHAEHFRHGRERETHCRLSACAAHEVAFALTIVFVMLFLLLLC
eukprot:TRINITY_DN647_c0_g1_i3.p1 TRINITY_DN647_c0_g1~~TRINITY_DN647_c0_g1_i3.p1  ORF type:complete len:115 (-),score=17.30 TRINITY_DN647_c0_g1_i3:125-469(-)